MVILLVKMAITFVIPVQDHETMTIHPFTRRMSMSKAGPAQQYVRQQLWQHMSIIGQA